MAETATDCLASLFEAAEDRHSYAVLECLVEGADYGWRCEAPLPADDGKPCEYLNVPLLLGEPADAPCQNCGAAPYTQQRRDQ